MNDAFQHAYCPLLGKTCLHNECAFFYQCNDRRCPVKNDHCTLSDGFRWLVDQKPHNIQRFFRKILTGKEQEI